MANKVDLDNIIQKVKQLKISKRLKFVRQLMYYTDNSKPQGNDYLNEPIEDEIYKFYTLAEKEYILLKLINSNPQEYYGVFEDYAIRSLQNSTDILEFLYEKIEDPEIRADISLLFDNEKLDPTNYQVVPAIISRIKTEDQLIEVFEHFAETNSGIFKNLFDYGIFDVNIIFEHLFYEEVLNLLPAEIFKHLSDEWIKAIYSDVEFLHIFNELPYNKRRAIIAELPDNFLCSEEFLECLKKDSKNYDFLPKEIRDRENIKKLFNRGNTFKQNLTDEWIDPATGKIVDYFTLGNNLQPRNKNDYMIIYNKYLEEKISVEAFCKKYRISSINGFNEMLERINAESYIEGMKIKEIKDNVQNRFVRRVRSVTAQIVDNKMSTDELMNENFNNNYTLEKFIRLSSDDEVKRAFCKKIIDYYVSKDATTFTENDMNFLDYNSHKTSLYNKFNTFIKQYLVSPADNEYIRKLANVKTNLGRAVNVYKRPKSTYSYTISGNTYEINNDIIDQAICYANNHHIFRSQVAINEIIRNIVLGNINIEDETIMQKEEMKDSLLEMLEEIKTIKEFVDNISQQND